MKYSKVELNDAAAKTHTLSGLCRILGIKPVGGNVSHIKKRCEELNIDISHFIGQRHRLGKPANNTKSNDKILILGIPSCGRTNSKQLRRAMLSENILYKCNICDIIEWNNIPLRLEIDHKNGKYWDNRLENLQFLCPNCHSQKPR